jgi:flagellar motor switch protein FliN/FliY
VSEEAVDMGALVPSGGSGEVLYPSFDGPSGAPAPASAADFDLVLDVPVELTVEIGRTTMTIREALAIGPGSIVALDTPTGEPVDLLVNGRRIARGEVVAVDEEYALRITEVVGERPSDGGSAMAIARAVTAPETGS